MKNVFVFTGPTLSPTEAGLLLEARYLPPVKQGDVYRVTLKQPVAIGIIDGFFEHVASVWHKEILWAMTQGIHVFGSASMGALRAAELDTFGMQGVGTIFEDYRRGILEDDDEVAVTHGPAEANYPVFSEAMVNIRATVACAVAEGVFGQEAGKALIGIAKALFYPERRYQLILHHAFEQGAVPSEELDAFRRWLPTGKVDQKCEDARAMLAVMHTQLEKGAEPKRVSFVFEHTDVWDNLTTQVVGLSSEEGETGVEDIRLDQLLDEVRLQGLDVYTCTRQGAQARLLLLEQAYRIGLGTGGENLDEAVARFRLEQGLLSAADVEQWLEERDLTDEQAVRLLEEEVLLHRMEDSMGLPSLLRAFPNFLRSQGSYALLLQRAQEKQQVLAEMGRTTPSLFEVGISEEALFQWYFEEVLLTLSQEDLAAYARALEYPHTSDMVTALLREYCYRQAASSEQM